jgi:hypothetical protein
VDKLVNLSYINYNGENTRERRGEAALRAFDGEIWLRYGDPRWSVFNANCLNGLEERRHHYGIGDDEQA